MLLAITFLGCFLDIKTASMMSNTIAGVDRAKDVIPACAKAGIARCLMHAKP
ncbi:hypothetical protein [Colwellia sp. BRX10-4]|jgi:hypothetical protein|uniref:hypothetical protein n=1 Tax=Colwellia sp. BRX10-4 TaxID=2759843 RepID=UPI0015F6F071|nr:hypothetical protein [Colwellia sp. BRX10-4]MBA6398688.1 hypothetical protein [Colwellia sp. BRX10-4]